LQDGVFADRPRQELGVHRVEHLAGGEGAGEQRAQISARIGDA
jgi:hypothetical protein